LPPEFAMLTGSLVAIATPMRAGGALDFDALRKLIDWHVAEGTSGIVVVGTTGESPTVDFDEHCELIRVAVEHAAGRIPVIAGTGANSTSEAIELTEYARKAGAHSGLSVVPYYNKPTQEGLYRHFRTIAEKVGLPLILYNVPGRTVADLANETVLRLAEVPGIIGLKDATADLGRGSELLRALAAGARRDFAVYSGEDITALPLMMMGGHGVISVTANVAPRLMHEMCAAALAGEVARAREINFKLLGLHKHLFVEANPIPVKWGVQQLGLIEGGIRLPLTPLSAQCQETVREAMREAGVLQQASGLRLVEGRGA
jgi:4-hydroxy-tetrahydrodipicolinate synthase